MSDPAEYAIHPEDHLTPAQLARRYPPRTRADVERREQQAQEAWERENLIQEAEHGSDQVTEQ